MPWIETVPPERADSHLSLIYAKLYSLYPPEYREEVAAVTRPDGTADSIVATHSLLPEVMLHVFSTHAQLMSAELPLSRRQHELIATLVSAINRCFY